MEDTESKKFKVNDKRRFDTDGSEKATAAQATQPNKPQSSQAQSSSAASETIAQDVQIEPTSKESFDAAEAEYQKAGAPDEGINFASFLASMATQALVQLGEMPTPEGIDMPVNPAAAKQTIDLLAMLKEKTTGNLDAQESFFMEEMIHSLRLAYLKHS